MMVFLGFRAGMQIGSGNRGWVTTRHIYSTVTYSLHSHIKPANEHCTCRDGSCHKAFLPLGEAEMSQCTVFTKTARFSLDTLGRMGSNFFVCWKVKRNLNWDSRKVKAGHVGGGNWAEQWPRGWPAAHFWSPLLWVWYFSLGPKSWLRIFNGHHRHPTVTHSCHFPDFFSHSAPCWYCMSPLCAHATDYVTAPNLSASLYTPCLPSRCLDEPIPFHWFCRFTELYRMEFMVFLPFLSQLYFVWPYFCSNCLWNSLLIPWLSLWLPIYKATT